MDLYYVCPKCRTKDIWRIRIQGTRPFARTLVGDVKCPVCQGLMEETGPMDKVEIRKVGPVLAH